MKSVMTAVLALGLSVAASSSGSAASAPSTAAALSTALAADNPVQLAATAEFRRVGPGPRVVAPRGRAVVPGRAVVVPGRAVVGPGRAVVVPGRAVVRPGYVGRPAYVGRPVFVRSYRPWYRRPYFGTIVGGVALGTILTAAAVGVAPAYPPADDLCWYWADPSMTTGYWDYCQ
jgi:hypothetical protein